MGTIKATNIEPIADNGTVTLGGSGDNLVLGSGAKSSFLYPAFFARLDGSQVVNDNTLTKVTINEEYFDTNNCFDHQTNYRFTPNVAGKYFLYGQIWFDAAVTANNLNQATIYIYKNTSDAISLSRADFRNTYGGRYNTLTTSFIADANGSSDYFELFGNINVQSVGSQGFYATSADTNGYTYFGGHRIGT